MAEYGLRKIVLQINSIFDERRFQAVKNYSGHVSVHYYRSLIIALNDNCRNIRNFAAKMLIKRGSDYADELLPYLAEYSLYRRNGVARIFGTWFPQFHRKKWYMILRGMPILEREGCLQQYMQNVLVESDGNLVFDAVTTLELIGDFRAIPILKHTTTILQSQLQQHFTERDEYSLFIICLYFLQHPHDEHIKTHILYYRLQDLILTARKYHFSEIFQSLFNDLGLFGQLVFQTDKLSLDQKILKTTEFAQGSWAYITLVWILTANYPKSVEEVEFLRKKSHPTDIYQKLETIATDIFHNFEIRLKSGFSILL